MQVSKVEIDDLSIIRVINDEAIPAVNSVSWKNSFGSIKIRSILRKYH